MHPDDEFNERENPYAVPQSSLNESNAVASEDFFAQELKPFRTIWTRPRDTVRRIIATVLVQRELESGLIVNIPKRKVADPSDERIGGSKVGDVPRRWAVSSRSSVEVFRITEKSKGRGRHHATPPPFDFSLGSALELVLTRALSSDQAVAVYLATQSVAIKQLAARAAVDVPHGLLRVSDLVRRRPRAPCRVTWFLASHSRWRCEAEFRCNA